MSTIRQVFRVRTPETEDSLMELVIPNHSCNFGRNRYGRHTAADDLRVPWKAAEHVFKSESDIGRINRLPLPCIDKEWARPICLKESRRSAIFLKA